MSASRLSRHVRLEPYWFAQEQNFHKILNENFIRPRKVFIFFVNCERWISFPGIYFSQNEIINVASHFCHHTIYKVATQSASSIYANLYNCSCRSCGEKFSSVAQLESYQYTIVMGQQPALSSQTSPPGPTVPGSPYLKTQARRR